MSAQNALIIVLGVLVAAWITCLRRALPPTRMGCDVFCEYPRDRLREAACLQACHRVRGDTGQLPSCLKPGREVSVNHK